VKHFASFISLYPNGTYPRMKNKEEFKIFQKQIKKWNIDIIQIDKVFHQSNILFTKYSLLSFYDLADALIAAKVVQTSETLFTQIDKHYNYIQILIVKD